MAESEVLRAPHVLEFPYKRSLGPVMGAFFTGLRDGGGYSGHGHPVVRWSYLRLNTTRRRDKTSNQVLSGGRPWWCGEELGVDRSPATRSAALDRPFAWEGSVQWTAWAPRCSMRSTRFSGKVLNRHEGDGQVQAGVRAHREHARHRVLCC